MADLLYGVEFSEDGQSWLFVTDEGDDRIVPAVYVSPNEAEARRASMAKAWPNTHYRVRGVGVLNQEAI